MIHPMGESFQLESTELGSSSGADSPRSASTIQAVDEPFLVQRSDEPVVQHAVDRQVAGARVALRYEVEDRLKFRARRVRGAHQVVTAERLVTAFHRLRIVGRQVL